MLHVCVCVCVCGGGGGWLETGNIHIDIDIDHRKISTDLAYISEPTLSNVNLTVTVAETQHDLRPITQQHAPHAPHASPAPPDHH